MLLFNKKSMQTSSYMVRFFNRSKIKTAYRIIIPHSQYSTTIFKNDSVRYSIFKFYNWSPCSTLNHFDTRFLSNTPDQQYVFRKTKQRGSAFNSMRNLFLISSVIGMGSYLIFHEYHHKLTSFIHNLQSYSTNLKTTTDIIKKHLNKATIKDPPLVLRMTDELFNTTDNLCIFWFTSEEEFESQRGAIHMYIERIQSLKLPVELNFAYSIRKASDLPSQLKKPFLDSKGLLPIMLYKGQRQMALLGITKDLPSNDSTLLKNQDDQFIQFFTPVSEEDNHNNNRNKQCSIQSVTYNSFQNEVINKSQSCPVLLQLQEKSCFLCFLMRPFIEAIGEILQKYKIPMEIKVLNLDNNDFPPGCPVVRSTPNFVFYTNSTSEKYSLWEEYKPKEFIERLINEFLLKADAKKELEETVDKLQERFRMFGLLTLWTQELYRLQQYYVEEKLANIEEQTDAMNEDYNNIINELIKEDILRTDNLLDNLNHLESQIESTVKDCIIYAEKLGHKLKTVEDYFPLLKTRLNSSSQLDLSDSDSTTTNEQSSIKKDTEDNEVSTLDNASSGSTLVS